MDMSDRRSKLELEKRNEEEPSNNNLPGIIPCDWRFNDASLGNSTMGGGGGGGVGPSCSSGAMVDSFGQTVWDHPVNTPSPSLGFGEMNVHNGMFGPNISGMLPHPHGISQFPADSAFIERAARFSSFSGGHFGELLNPFGIQQSGLNPFLRGQDLLSGNGNKTLPIIRQAQNCNNATVAETSEDVSAPLAKQGGSMSNDSGEPEFSGGAARDDSTTVSPAKGTGTKKRKRVLQNAESEQTNGTHQKPRRAAGSINPETPNEEQNPDQIGSKSKSNGKHAKQTSQNSDPPKDEYIHVRARRGQATNSHSLAERVRREKISERMKFLQDLVPGCSKVTGKAVMLDEIINYVQSLQRQVEFLSMKLATVNPRLDFNIEQLLAKDHVLPGCSSIGNPASMPLPYPPLHPSQSPGIPGVGSFSDILRTTISSHLTNTESDFKEPAHHQLPNNTWEDELHNVVQMGLNACPHLDNQDATTNCPAADQGPMKSDHDN